MSDKTEENDVRVIDILSRDTADIYPIKVTMTSTGIEINCVNRQGLSLASLWVEVEAGTGPDAKDALIARVWDEQNPENDPVAHIVMVADIKAAQEIIFDDDGTKMKLIPLTEPPNVGDVVWHENRGLVKYRVDESYTDQVKASYPDAVMVQVIRDYGNGYFKPGHLSVRDLNELMKAVPLEEDKDAPVL